MTQLRTWFCRKRGDLLRWSLVLAALTPLVAWSISRSFPVDGPSVVVVIGSVLFAVWRPYRDSWLRSGCSPAKPCASR